MAALLAVCATGCTSSPGTPRTRIGSLPFPGLFSLYAVADPENLGVHCAGPPLLRLGSAWEKERGTLYTRRAGFIDLSHARDAADWVHYLHGRNLHALRAIENEGHSTVSYQFDDCNARITITVSPPEWWGAICPETRGQLIQESAICSAQRLAVVVTTWHEAATWLGYQTIPGISEAGSAFTWDDGAAHIVGALVGGRALRNMECGWDHAVTRELDAALAELEVVNRREFAEAARSVRDRWWKDGVAIRRDFDVGLAGTGKTPWLVGEFGTEPGELSLPDLGCINGHDLSAMFHVRIEPAKWMMRRLMEHAADEGAVIDGEHGVLAAVELVRVQMRAKFGEGFDRP